MLQRRFAIFKQEFTEQCCCNERSHPPKQCHVSQYTVDFGTECVLKTSVAGRSALSRGASCRPWDVSLSRVLTAPCTSCQVSMHRQPTPMGMVLPQSRTQTRIAARALSPANGQDCSKIRKWCNGVSRSLSRSSLSSPVAMRGLTLLSNAMCRSTLSISALSAS